MAMAVPVFEGGGGGGGGGENGIAGILTYECITTSILSLRLLASKAVTLFVV